MSVVHIVDYGIGNLYSVSRAIEKAGGEARLTSDAGEIARADRILLPGVGAYEPCISTLRQTGLADPVLEFAATGRPFLGICVGMQLLFDYSLEFGRHEGLGLIPGHVAAIPASDDAGTRKVPHIGWSPLLVPEGRNGWEDTLLDGAEPGVSSTYFVHSFNCVPDDPARRLAEADYAGFAVCAAVEKDNITAFQCHPEKSGPAGLRILENFLRK
ncbi:imidazole glycerol phosphate synthase subunit HisH [Sphingomonas sp.]|uniref:imidazole glycerol phosphate synthase subunit HisH n=1 Tax=Sphingomonas sp. TaxID=28214 RepID=UPI0031DBB3FE